MKYKNRIITVHNKFKSIPNHTFYFKNSKLLIKYCQKLIDQDFSLNIRINFKKYSIKEINSILSFCLSKQELSKLKSCKNKVEIVYHFGEKHGF